MLDIPDLLAAYNEYRDDAETLKDKDMAIWRLSRLKALPEERQPAHASDAEVADHTVLRPSIFRNAWKRWPPCCEFPHCDHHPFVD